MVDSGTPHSLDDLGHRRLHCAELEHDLRLDQLDCANGQLIGELEPPRWFARSIIDLHWLGLGPALILEDDLVRIQPNESSLGVAGLVANLVAHGLWWVGCGGWRVVVGDPRPAPEGDTSLARQAWSRTW